MVKPSIPDAHSSSDLDKRYSINEKEDLESASDLQQQAAEMDAVPVILEKEQAVSKPIINVSDWNGPDDPDNPHNCMCALLVGISVYSLFHRVIME
jgi:hypothetical protein